MFKKFTCLAVLALLITSQLQAFEISEDAQYVYTKRGLSELPDDRLRLIMNHFYEQLTDQLNVLGVETDWTDESQEVLIGNQDRFSSLISKTQEWADRLKDDTSINLDEFFPTGFILGLGVNGSGELVVGMGGGALLTLIVVPQEVERFDKLTGEIKKYLEASWSIGGLAQWGVGAGTGGGIVARGAFGLIWGKLPEADDLTGVGVGINGNIALVQGVGIKSAVLFNTTTHKHNLVVLVTLDLGVTAEASIHASMSYFMPAKHIISFLTHNKIKESTGVSILPVDETAAH